MKAAPNCILGSSEPTACIPLAEALLGFGDETEVITAPASGRADAVDEGQTMEPDRAVDWTELAPLVGSSLVGEAE